jgi:hypothetical protein
LAHDDDLPSTFARSSVRLSPHNRHVADWTAITGIIVSGAVGPSLGALWALAHQRRQLDQDLVLRDTAELRELLDDAAQKLERARKATGAIVGELASQAAGYGHVSEETVGTFSDAAEDAAAAGERLRIRLTRAHVVTVTHERAMQALRDGGAEVVVLVAAPPLANLEEVEKAFRASYKTVVEAQHEFQDEAYRLIGSRVAVPQAWHRRAAARLFWTRRLRDK